MDESAIICAEMIDADAEAKKTTKLSQTTKKKNKLQ